MASIPLLLKDEIECLDTHTRLDSFGVCPVKRAIAAARCLSHILRSI
jgi:hypothetical protein